MRPLSHVVSFVTGAIVLGTLSVVYAWTGPTQSPPNGNVSAPINVGVTNQIKDGGLGVNSLAVYGNAILSGASRYLNFGTTAGDTGYGIRDNAGAMQFKNNGGSWQNFGASSGGGDNLGNHTATQNVNMNNFKISSLAAPTSASDAATKAYVDSLTGASETDPQVSTLTANRYCKANSAGTAIVCSTTACGDAPNGTVVAVSGCTSNCTGSFIGIRVSTCVNGTVQTTNCPSSGRCSCFTKDARVAMADGTIKAIHEIRAGDIVRGKAGTNTVLDIDHTLLWKGKPQHLIRINGGEAIMTDNHPVMTTEGWKAVNPGLAEREAYDQLSGKVTTLEVGDELILANTTMRITSIEIIPQSDEPIRLYNLHLDGDHTFYANDMLVHGVVPDAQGRFLLDRDHLGE